MLFRRGLSTRGQLPLERKMMPQSWDSHMHVVDPQRYPLSTNAVYTPSSHTLSQAFAFHETSGIQKFVLVQPSIYGNDNTCLLDALKQLGPRRGRGVVTFAPDTIQRKTLDEWHGLGVHSVRVNLKSVGSNCAKSGCQGLHRPLWPP